MLLNDFYKIKSLSEEKDTGIIAYIELNPEHQIYKGHFPANPVVPGVVSIQMINEVLSEFLKFKLITSEAKSIKFTSMINPKINTKLYIKINYLKTEENNFKVSANISFDEIIFLKFKGLFKAEKSTL